MCAAYTLSRKTRGTEIIHFRRADPEHITTVNLHLKQVDRIEKTIKNFLDVQ